MITIVKDGVKILCSKNTYESMYKRLGYEVLGEQKPKVEFKKEEIKEEPKEEIKKADEKKIKGKK